jgi:hypothetical protein
LKKPIIEPNGQEGLCIGDSEEHTMFPARPKVEESPETTDRHEGGEIRMLLLGRARGRPSRSPWSVVCPAAAEPDLVFFEYEVDSQERTGFEVWSILSSNALLLSNKSAVQATIRWKMRGR